MHDDERYDEYYGAKQLWAKAECTHEERIFLLPYLVDLHNLFEKYRHTKNASNMHCVIENFAYVHMFQLIVCSFVL